MASIFAHALVAYTGNKLYPTTNYAWRILFFAVLWSILPDLDSIGFFLGIAYPDVLGHRGLTHSLFFALITSIILVKTFFANSLTANTQNNHRKKNIVLVLFFTSIMVSHGILDAMTNGGLGIAFFAPFDNTRYFFPWRPIAVSPLGIKSFFSDWGVRVIISELLWVAVPCSIMLFLTRLVRPKH